MKKLLMLFFLLATTCLYGSCADNNNNVNNISVTELSKIANKNPNEIVIVDVRTPEEHNKEHAKGAVNIPAYEYIGGNWVEIDGFVERIDSMYRNSGKKLYLICTSAVRSKNAVSLLLNDKWGNDVFNVVGGTNAWIDANLETTSSADTNTQ